MPTPAGRGRAQPDDAAMRPALWRALRLKVDAPPYVLEDRIGLELIIPGRSWRDRPDMDPGFTAGSGPSSWPGPLPRGCGGRARGAPGRAVHDLRAPASTPRPAADGPGRAGAGVEIDQPGTQEWKRRRLGGLGCAVPDGLRIVPSGFEAAGGSRRALLAAGFDPAQLAVVAATRVSMSLTKEADAATLREIAPPGPRHDTGDVVPAAGGTAGRRRTGAGSRSASAGAAAAGTPFRSFFTPDGVHGHWPARRDSPTCGTYRRPIRTHALHRPD